VSRRARKYQPRPVYANAVQISLARVKPLSAADVAGQAALIQHALAQFCQGANCDMHWRSLADAANMAETLAGMGLGSGDDATRVIELAQRALADVHQRHTTRGSWTLYADEIDALHWLVRLHCTAQLPARSYGELSDAMAATRNRLQQALAGNAPRSALVIDGGMGSSPNT
jgi:hypothetical protein